MLSGHNYTQGAEEYKKILMWWASRLLLSSDAVDGFLLCSL